MNSNAISSCFSRSRRGAGDDFRAVLDSVISERENERVNDVGRLYWHENGCRLLVFPSVPPKVRHQETKKTPRVSSKSL